MSDPTGSPPAGRLVEVAPERLARWLAGFADRHGPTSWTASPYRVDLLAEDGARARCEVPFPPLPGQPGPGGAGGTGDRAFAGLVEHALVDRRVGVLLVRLGGHAAGVFEGSALVVSKVGSRQVHGRSAAGGQSQKRFARRREGQVRVALAAAADVAARVLLPEAARLDALVTGGDRRAVTDVLGDPRLAALRPLVVERFLPVPDPRLRVLEAAGAGLRAVRVTVVDPAPG